MTENTLFFIPVLTGLVFIITGIILLKFPPKKRNSFYGYRTASSMKNQERWDFAQIYSSKEMIKLGSLLALLGLIGLKYRPDEETGVFWGMVFLILIVIVLIVRVELAIKNKFKKSA
ncbi:MAG: SdpI family protein [Prolixibacteraceae bacterium]|nr:SdpI family protein [Prolixibacteraceae bacterium]